MKKKTKKKVQRSQFRKRRNIYTYGLFVDINEKDKEFFKFMAKASREGRL